MAAKGNNIMTINTLAGHCKIFKSTICKQAVDIQFLGQKIGERWRFHKDVVDERIKRGVESRDSKVREK